MIDEFTDDRSGWARFSDDRLKRYRLGRVIVPSLGPFDRLVTGAAFDVRGRLVKRIIRITFVLLNPSTADAFKPDQTVTRCVKFATAWGADLIEIVNLFSIRTPYPDDVKLAEDRGGDTTNDIQILRGCHGAHRIIAGWGNHGVLDNRGTHVRRMLVKHGYKLFHLGLNDNGTPKHPMARGRARIPDDAVPVEMDLAL